jgi:hypothetical protein
MHPAGPLANSAAHATICHRFTVCLLHGRAAASRRPGSNNEEPFREMILSRPGDHHPTDLRGNSAAGDASRLI